MTVHFISVGISILDNLRDSRRMLRDRGKPDLDAAVRGQKPWDLAGLADRDRDSASDWLAGALAAPGGPARDEGAAESLAAMNLAIRPDQWPGEISAEVATFARTEQPHRPLPAGDIALLLCSDTSEGLVAGLWNASVLADGDVSRIRYLAGPDSQVAPASDHVLQVRVPGMDASNEAGFRRAMGGLGALGRNLLHSGELGPGEPFVFYLSGGFKAAIPYLIGLAEGLNSLPEAGPVTAYVLHETAQRPTPIRLPLRRMSPDRVCKELKDLTEQPRTRGPGTDYLDGYAYERTTEGWRLTAFGVGLKALFGIPAPGLGT